MMKTIEGYTYKINEHIGKGYSSTVHKGIKDATGQAVSIKVIEMAKLQDPINQMLLQHQITALKKLTHSNFNLHFYDVYATKNNTYIITQLCEGDLASMLKHRKTIPYYEAIEIMRQLMNGYMDIYRIGYLHRDIKPANIFYKANNYKIGDFGFAIPVNEVDKHKNYNVGSPVYMPPQALKQNKYGVSCDTWALGVIFFQLIKGVVPWRAISQQKLHQKIISQPIEQLTVGLPQVVRAFLSRVLHLDPEQRMSVEEMVSWQGKLSAVEVRTGEEPLRELKNKNRSDIVVDKMIYTPKQVPSSTVLVNHSPTPKLKNNRTHSDRQYFHKNNLSNHQNQLKKEQIYKQAQQFSANFINYIRFIHRILKFLGSPTQLKLGELEDALTCHLHQQLQNIEQLMSVPSLCSVEKWDAFITSQKGTQLKKKISTYKSKYRMFHPQNKYVLLSEGMIRSGINELLGWLQAQERYSEKIVIGADYLTTMFQLLDLKDKYCMKEFLKVSKIEIIMQGNPYNVSKEHLTQLRKKVTLLDI